VTSARAHLLAAVESAPGAVTARELTETLGWPRARVGMALLRARRQGLVVRRDGGYLITLRGQARLSWFEEQAT